MARFVVEGKPHVLANEGEAGVFGQRNRSSTAPGESTLAPLPASSR